MVNSRSISSTVHPASTILLNFNQGSRSLLHPAATRFRTMIYPHPISPRNTNTSTCTAWETEANDGGCRYRPRLVNSSIKTPQRGEGAPNLHEQGHISSRTNELPCRSPSQGGRRGHPAFRAPIQGEQGMNQPTCRHSNRETRS